MWPSTHGYTVTQVSLIKKYDIKILFFLRINTSCYVKANRQKLHSIITFLSSTRNNKTDKHTPWAQEPVALPDMGIFVLQMSVWPDEGLRGEHNPVLGLLELLEQLFGTRGKNHIVAKSLREWKQKTLVHSAAQHCVKPVTQLKQMKALLLYDTSQS